jgi:hypothetical protein
MSLLEDLEDLDELNRHMDADPELAMNMLTMGFIKRVPFQQDYNNATVAKWTWTDYGRSEMLQRLDAGAEFQFGLKSK